MRALDWGKTKTSENSRDAWFWPMPSAPRVVRRNPRKTVVNYARRRSGRRSRFYQRPIQRALTYRGQMYRFHITRDKNRSLLVRYIIPLCRYGAMMRKYFYKHIADHKYEELRKVKSRGSLDHHQLMPIHRWGSPLLRLDRHVGQLCCGEEPRLRTEWYLVSILNWPNPEYRHGEILRDRHVVPLVEALGKHTSEHRKRTDLGSQTSATLGDLPEVNPPFTGDEFGNTFKEFHPRKSPGIDGFTSDICQAVWKVAAIKVIPKPGKDDYTRPKSYCLIDLLFVLDKTVEIMLVGSLKWHLMPKLQATQYGIMPQRGSRGALYYLMTHIYKEKQLKLKKIILMVSLDIESAFATRDGRRCRPSCSLKTAQ
ncbi:LINE-1 reverse transcriptase homolog [Eumeta japonica]|uniref:LINE-1 reverse transcriptase homolog n=1 Tax=Eumeta variegata TaxID=151549 RepID=A0A4C1Y6Z2_EUMVA|nr:LINE-1 reverse transcriptase homolog [Eumeta japonica]